jgi:hypothetical protein
MCGNAAASQEWMDASWLAKSDVRGLAHGGSSRQMRRRRRLTCSMLICLICLAYMSWEQPSDEEEKAANMLDVWSADKPDALEVLTQSPCPCRLV